MKFKRELILLIFIFSSNLFSQDKIYPISVVDTPPLFSICQQFNEFEQKKCFEDFIKSHISENIIFPVKAFEEGVGGRVLAYFTVDSLGKIDEVKTRGPHPSLKIEAERLINTLPKLKPAFLNSSPVKISYSIPIDFYLVSRPSSKNIKIFPGANVYLSADKKSKIVAIVKNKSSWTGSSYGNFWMINFTNGFGYVSKDDSMLDDQITVSYNSINDTRNI